MFPLELEELLVVIDPARQGMPQPRFGFGSGFCHRRGSGRRSCRRALADAVTEPGKDAGEIGAALAFAGFAIEFVALEQDVLPELVNQPDEA